MIYIWLYCRASVLRSEWSSENGGFRRRNSWCTVFLWQQCISWWIPVKRSSEDEGIRRRMNCCDEDVKLCVHLCLQCILQKETDTVTGRHRETEADRQRGTDKQINTDKGKKGLCNRLVKFSFDKLVNSTNSLQWCVWLIYDWWKHVMLQMIGHGVVA